jgi:predicted NUDIX family NTP pyrophosphohydrolase
MDPELGRGSDHGSSRRLEAGGRHLSDVGSTGASTAASKARTAAISAGILLFRRQEGVLEVLLAHPGGPFFARQDAGAWTLPKGEPDPGEASDPAALLAVARREFEEETGHRADGPVLPLGSIVQKGGKAVHAWAVEGDLDAGATRSNTFEIEWPPRSGRRATFPEVDRVAWFRLDEARRRIRPAQVPLLERLAEVLGS